jgi:hypothetical protein
LEPLIGTSPPFARYLGPELNGTQPPLLANYVVLPRTGSLLQQSGRDDGALTVHAERRRSNIATEQSIQKLKSSTLRGNNLTGTENNFYANSGL